MRSRFIKAYTLVEMLVALAVSAIIIGATYASYEMVARQYHKNMDIADMHTSGRAIMRIIKRDVRMAGFEYRDKDARITYGSISNPITIKDSGNKCCDEVTVIYDYFDEESKKAERIRIRYWTEPHTSNKGSRHRLYKQKDILGQNKKMLAKPKLGSKDVMADYIEDLQISNAASSSTSKPNITTKIDAKGNILPLTKKTWSCVYDKKTDIVWQAVGSAPFSWYNTNPLINLGEPGYDNIITSCAGYTVGSSKTYCNTQAYTEKINKQGLCGANNWRLPTKSELWGLVSKKRKNPSIDIAYFPNTPTNGHWTSSMNVGKNPDEPWVIYFDYGHPGDNSKRRGHNVMLAHKWNSTNELINLISIDLTLRTKNQYGKDRQFKKQDYHGGNYKIDKTDKYKRDTFSTTVLVRNLAL